MKRLIDKYLPKAMVDVAEGVSLNLWIADEIFEKLNISVIDIYFSKETPYHFHKKTQELFRFYNKGKVVLEGEEFEVDKNTMLYVPANLNHKLIPNGILKSTLITVPKFDPSDEYIVD